LQCRRSALRFKVDVGSKELMKVAAIIQARLASTRLPGKVLKDLAGKPILEWVVRAAREIPGVDSVIVATSS
jgi:spore coat polysaccharide biosynthesis protein SpsF